TRSPIISPLAWIKPELAALVKAAPKGTDWLHEMKLDGYRMHARLDAGHVQILTRRGNDWTAKYPTIVNALTKLPVLDAWAHRGTESTEHLTRHRLCQDWSHLQPSAHPKLALS